MIVGTDEKVAESRPTAVTSACRVTAKKPGPSGSACQCTGSCSRSHWNCAWGWPFAKLAGSDRSIRGALAIATGY